jgi:hypothetical protein
MHRMKWLLTAAVTASSTAAFAGEYGPVVWSFPNSSFDQLLGPADGYSLTFDGPLLDTQSSGEDNYLDYYPALNDFANTGAANVPKASDELIQIDGGNSTTGNLTFSSPVDNLVVDALNDGAPGDVAGFEYSHPFVIMSPGADQWGDAALTQACDIFYGTEGSGAVLFAGPTSSLTWTLPGYEYRYGFTLAIPSSTPSTPAPGALLAFAGGIVFRRRMGQRANGRGTRS